MKTRLAILILLLLATVALFTFNHSKPKNLPEPIRGSGKVMSEAKPRVREMPTAPSQTSPPLDKANHEMAKLGRQQTEISKQLRQLESNVKEIKSSSALRDQAEESQAPMDSEAIRASETDREEKFMAQMQAQVNMLDAAFNSEAPDLQWSAQTRSALEERLSQSKELKIDLRDVQCGSSLCRLEIVMPQDQNTQESHHRFVDLISWNSESFSRIDPEGGVTIYVARENYSLPRVTD